MLPKVDSFLFTLLFLVSLSITIVAQAPTSADVMRERISKAKAHLVVKNYSAAIYELENIRRETNDRTIHRALNILLMHAYLEQGDYKRTQKFLNDLFKSKKSTAADDYLVVAGQVVSGAKTQFRRYEILGLDVSDEKLPSYAVEDLDQMRKTLELIIEQSKIIGKNRRLTPNSLALLEETSSARGNIARDDYDARRWQNEITYARQQIANSGSRVINAVDNSSISAPEPNLVAVNRKLPAENIEEDVSEKPVALENADERNTDTAAIEKSNAVSSKEPEKKSAKNDRAKSDTLRPTDRPIRVIGSAPKGDVSTTRKEDSRDERENTKAVPRKNVKRDASPPKKVEVTQNDQNDGSPLSVGSLINYATKRVNPVYPRQARSMRMGGIVRVELTVDEEGKVSKIETTEGPALLRRAARDAIRKWEFRPFKRGGQPTKATGFVSFNFNL